MAAVKTVLLVAATTGYQIRSFGEAAATVGARLVIASDRCGQLHDPWWDGAVPVRFHEPDASLAAVAAAFGATPPDGIVAVGDRPAVLAAHLARVFGRAWHPPGAAAASRNKQLMREALRRANLPVPSFHVVPLAAGTAALAGMWTYPVVIKPLALSGSRGVMRVDDAQAFVRAFERLQHLLRSPDVVAERDAAHAEVLVESYVPGREYALEGVMSAGRLQVLAIFDKPDPLEGPCFEETLYVTPSRAPAETQRAITDATAAAAQAIGLWHGAVHAECRVHPAGVYVLEVAARPIGGLCAAALRFTAPDGRTMSLEELLLRHALGEQVSGITRERDASGVMMIPVPARGIYRGVTGVEAARTVPGVHDLRITAKLDSLLLPLPEARSYLGFIFARGRTPAAVERSLRQAHAHLQFTIQRALPVH